MFSHSSNTVRATTVGPRSMTQTGKQAQQTTPVYPASNNLFPGLSGGFIGAIGSIANQLFGRSNPFASAAASVMSAVQGAASNVEHFNQQALQQAQSFIGSARSDISSFNHVLQTNNIVNAIMLPITNMPLFMSNAQNAITNLESQINTEMSYMSIQFSSITSVAVYDINMAVSDISKLLNSLYTFSQKSIEILLSSPVLQMLPMLNPMAMMVAGVIASDPVLMISNYTAWQSQYSSRQSLVSNNFNTMYTMVSTGLPQIENVLLSLMTRISMLADHLTIHLPTGTDLTRSLMNESFARQITAALAGIDGISELPGLDAESNELHAALQSAAFYHLHTGDITAQSTHDDDGVFNTPTPTSAV